MPGTRRRNVSLDPHAYERTAPPIIESEFLQSNNRGAVQLWSPYYICDYPPRQELIEESYQYVLCDIHMGGNPLPCPAFLLSYRGLTSCAARSRFGFRDGGTASIPLPRA